MLADGKDQPLLRACVVDSIGREITTANVPITIYVTGDAKITGTENGIPVLLVKAENGTSIWSSNIIKGYCPLLFQTGNIPDRVKVEIKSHSL
jgi:hypothetical protein